MGIQDAATRLLALLAPTRAAQTHVSRGPRHSIENHNGSVTPRRLQARHHKGPGHSKSNRRRRQRSLESSSGTPQSDGDSGERWRIRMPSGMFMYHSEGRIAGSGHFFALFLLRRASAAGSHVLCLHGGSCLGRVPAKSEQLAVLPPLSAPDVLQAFWLQRRPSSGRIGLWMQPDGASYLCEDRQRPGTLMVADRAAQSGSTCAPEFELQRVVAATLEVETNRTRDQHAFERTVHRSTMDIAGRKVILATYHNVGMIHWATLFWGWLQASGIAKLLLLDLDGLTCQASRALLGSHAPKLQIECATAADMTLGRQYVLGKSASGMQDWGTRSNSGYFKFLRMKLRLVELVNAHGVDIVIADVDVIVLSSQFLSEMVGMGKDLVISSDARTGSYNDNYHCPCSHPMYQRHTADWVCAGLFYMRSTHASSWFMKQVQRFMDDFTITDQDAIQGLLTGHTQVAVPQVPSRRKSSGSKAIGGAVSPLAPGFRPSGLWLKPMWLESLSAPGNLRDVTGIVPLNTPMRPNMWRKCQAKQQAEGFTWALLSLDRYGNGPVMVHHWASFGAGAASGHQERGNASSFLSIHANCNAKVLLEGPAAGASFLTHPPLTAPVR